MRVRCRIPAAAEGAVRLIGNPLNFSRTPVSYGSRRPRLGQDTPAVLDDPDDA